MGPTPLLMILGIGLAGGLKLLVDPRQISRIYGLKDERALKTARIVAPILITLTYACPAARWARWRERSSHQKWRPQSPPTPTS